MPAIAIVGVGAVLPDALDVPAFWENLKTGRYSISEVTPDRWDPAKYYDPDPKAPDKSYSKIGGWVRAGDAILNEVPLSGTDMIVMGGYGHSRFREFILGGATRDVLSASAVPVLMAH